MSLLEVVGILAIISILFAVITPKIFSAITRAQVQTAVQSIRSARAAVELYYGRHGELPPAGPIDAALIEEGYLEGPLDAPFVDDAGLYNVEASSDDVFQVDGGDEFDLDADGRTGDDVGAETSGRVVHARLEGVGQETAEELNEAIDGPHMGAEDDNRSGYNEDPDGIIDVYGRVIYDGEHGGFPTTVYVYLLHR